MRNEIQDIGFTKTSSKGQVVIPIVLRKRLGIKEGTVFSVAARKGMIVLKKVDSELSEQDLKSLRLIEEAWRDVERGRYRVMSKKSIVTSKAADIRQLFGKYKFRDLQSAKDELREGWH